MESLPSSSNIQQLGVADSGELIGLTKPEMEATLATLENMAGEIGASVIISREIEVRGRLSDLALDAINGMERTTSNPTSSNLASAEASTSDTETSEADASATDDQDTDAADSLSATENVDNDPDEVIVRSAPVPIMQSFLRRSRKSRHEGKEKRRLDRDKTLMPQDLLHTPDITGTVEEASSDVDVLGRFEDGDVDPSLGVLELANLHISDSLKPTGLLGSDNETKPMHSKKTKLPKVPKPVKGDKDAKDAKIAKGPTPFPKRSPEEVARKMADKRAKRDKRREERKRALMDPVYDHGDFGTQDGATGGVAYDALIGGEADGNDADTGWFNVDTTSPTTGFQLLDSVATLKPTENDSNSPETHSSHDDTGNSPSLQPTDPTSTTVSIYGREQREQQSYVSSSTVTVGSHAEPRLIVEALVVRKAGFGRGFVDLSQFDEELRHLPSFSLN